MKALVVEDDKNMAYLLTRWLVSCGYEVQSVATLREAIEQIKLVPDLQIITLDLNLADSTYRNTVPQIRAIRQQNPEALLVVISGVATYNDEASIIALGADAMIEKHDIPTERTFIGRLSDVVSALFKNPTGTKDRSEALGVIAKKIASRCGALDFSIGEALSKRGAKKDIEQPQPRRGNGEEQTNP